MLRGPITAVVLLTAAIVAGPAAGHSATDEPIIVTGQRDIDQQIDNFVSALTPVPANGQLARFETAICPAALGLPANIKSIVEQRIRDVAAAVGLRVAGADCTANVLVMVTTDKAQLMKTLRTKYPEFFSDLTPAQERAVVRQPGHAAAWQSKRFVNADGQTLDYEDGVLVNRTTRQAGRIAFSARPTFSAAAVVVETAALDGLSATQLADYAVMRTLAHTDPARLEAGGPASILRVIDDKADGDLPATLTEWDFSFLKGLYSSPKNLRASAERSEIERLLRLNLESEAEPAN